MRSRSQGRIEPDHGMMEQASPRKSVAGPALVSVVIPAHNAAGVIGMQLHALSRQTYSHPFEVLVVDNRSTDNLHEVVSRYSAALKLRIVQAPDRAGVSYARNVGCRAASGDLIAICDADDVVDRHWLAGMVDAAADADLVGGRLDAIQLNSPTARRWRGGATGAANGLPTTLRHLPYAPGSNLALWRRVFEALGGWDEDLHGGGDDVDFSWRAQEAEFVLGHAGAAVIHYRLREGLRSAMRQMSAYKQADAALLRRHGRSGASPTPVRRLLGDLVWLATRSPYLLMFWSWRQGRWLVKAAALWGHIRGSVRHRIWAL